MSKIHVLFLAANPGNTRRLAIDEEMRAIEQKVRASLYRDTLVFRSAWAVRADDLLQLLNQYCPHIVHFSGHGSNSGLSLVGDDGRAILVTAPALQALFATLKDNIQFVLLNACYTSEQARALVQVIGCVIGMKNSLHDNVATIFASSFYRALGFGRSMQEAFDQGIAALLLAGLPGDIPELLVKDGIDPAQIRLIAPTADPAYPSSAPVAVQQQIYTQDDRSARYSSFTGRIELYSPEMMQLSEALLNGYPSTADLRLLISYALHENLEIIAPGGSLAEKVHSLVVWAISQGKVQELVNGALKRNPGNPQLRRFGSGQEF